MKQERPDSMPSDMENVVVYGTVDGSTHDVVFIPLERAKLLASVHDAKNSATTWQRLHDSIPTDDFERLALTEVDEDVDAFDALSLAEQEAFLTGSFDADDVDAIIEGDWPGWPQQEMLNWMPNVVQEEFGEIVQSMINGPCLEIGIEHTKDVVAALQKYGYTCVENNELVSSASGY